jgi:hypothetical protein
MAVRRVRDPIVVYEDGLYGFILISTVADASDFLFRHWPGNNNPTWVQAMCCCEGEAPAEEARALLVAALEEAGMRYHVDISG